MTSHDERSARVQFSERYATPSAAVSHDIERRVIGAVWGVNGYTTLNQADEIGRLLHLGPSRLLLDVGTGRGWPGLHLAQTTGCTVVGTDMPIEGLEVAAQIARWSSRPPAPTNRSGQVRSMRSCSPTFSVDYGRSSPCCERSSGSFDPEVESLQRRFMWLKASGRPLVGERYAPDHEPSPPAARRRACSTRRASPRSENATSHPSSPSRRARG